MLLLHSSALSASVQGGLQDICTADNIQWRGKNSESTCCERRTYASSQLLVGSPFGSYAM